MKKIEDVVEKNPVVLFDGVCNLCSDSVQLIIKNDQRNLFKFSTLQSPLAQFYLKKQVPNLSKIDSIILVTSNKIYTKSSAALIIAKHLKGGYPLLYIFYIIPKPIRDFVYDFIAKNRYKWFGKKEHCMIPTKELKNKFL
ncbi:thiol-disulfide oxidoreductase DCC family protein [Wenyingzhuangia sp. IMCC45533]